MRTVRGYIDREASEMRADFVVGVLYFYRIRKRCCVTWRNKPAICRDADGRDCACGEASTAGLLPSVLTGRYGYA